MPGQRGKLPSGCRCSSDRVDRGPERMWHMTCKCPVQGPEVGVCHLEERFTWHRRESGPHEWETQPLRCP